VIALADSVALIEDGRLAALESTEAFKSSSAGAGVLVAANACATG